MSDEQLKPAAADSIGRVLIADDEEMNRWLFRDLLEAEGHCVLLAEDGAEALEKALTQNPGAILLDVAMPKLDGFEVCRRLRLDPRTAHIPILVVTGLESHANRLTGIQAGANDFLSKPVDNIEIQLRVRNAVYQQQLYNELQARYQELKDMAELRESLTSIIEADTAAMSSLMPQPPQTERTMGGNLMEGDDHGAC